MILEELVDLAVAKWDHKNVCIAENQGRKLERMREMEQHETVTFHYVNPQNQFEGKYTLTSFLLHKEVVQIVEENFLPSIANEIVSEKVLKEESTNA